MYRTWLIKNYLKQKEKKVKDIGENFKYARETIGLSKEEVLKDLNITASQLENLEDGNINAFKDIFFLKDLIKKYTTYLNLDEESIMDEFNNFIFSYTSRIPVDEILEKTKEIKLQDKESNEKKVVSPYTMIKVKKEMKYTYIYIASMIVLALLVILIVKYIKNYNETKEISYNLVERGY